ncbi:MAG: glutathione S-transferase family protein [Thermoplasmatota archaeon]
MHLYGHSASGNVYKTELILALTNQAFAQTQIKWGTPEIAAPEFLALNPAGRVPVLKDGDFVLPESNAQLWYLAQGTPFWPESVQDQAQVLRWLFWEQYSHEPFIAVIRYLRHYGAPGPETEQTIASKMPGAIDALNVMEQALAGSDWLVKEPSIADLALYAYTHVSHEAGLPLDPYPNIKKWTKRVESLPGFVPMTAYSAAAEPALAD